MRRTSEDVRLSDTWTAECPLCSFCEKFDQGVVMAFDDTASQCVGNRLIDAQHHGVMAAFRTAVATVLQGGDTSATVTAFDDAVQRFAENCACEESLMQRTGYPNLRQHRREHDRFLEAALRVAAGVARRDRAAVGEHLLLLDEWLFRHIQQADRAFVRFLDHRNDTTNATTPRRLDSGQTPPDAGQIDTLVPT